MKKRDSLQDAQAALMLGCAGVILLALGVVLLVLMVAVLR